MAENAIQPVQNCDRFRCFQRHNYNYNTPEATYHITIDNDRSYINKYYIIFPGQYHGTPSSIQAN
jgi:hypothetical protein